MNKDKNSLGEETSYAWDKQELESILKNNLLILEGSSFLLRTWQDGDQTNLIKSANNPNLTKTLFDCFSNPYTLQDAEEWINTNVSYIPNQLNLCIEVDGKAVGGVGIVKKDWNNSLTGIYGYWIAEEHWGKGIVSEATKIFLDYVFENTKLIRIEASTFNNNIGSEKLLQKNNFQFEGILKNNILKDEKLFDENVFGLNRPDISSELKQSEGSIVEKSACKQLILELVNNLDVEEQTAIISDLLEILSLKKETKKWGIQNLDVPKFEDENFKLSSEDTKDWITKEMIGEVNGEKKTILVKENPEGDVWEYVSGIPENLIGEQLFTWDAMIRETDKAKKKLPIVNLDRNDFWIAMENMEGNNEQERYESFLKKTNVQFSGFRYTDVDFLNIGDEAKIWSNNEYTKDNARYSEFYKNIWVWVQYHKRMAMSVRCLKDE